MRKTIVAILGAALLSCAPAAKVEPPLKDWSSAYPPLLQVLPGDAYVLAFADAGHFIDRMAALEKLVLASPKAKTELTPYLAKMQEALGFDAFDAKAWEAQGLAVHAPLAFFFANDNPWLVFKAGDKLKTWMESKGGGDTKCQLRDPWLICGDAKKTPPDAPADAKQSAWARIVEAVPAETRQMDVLGFMPLAALLEKEKVEFVHNSKAAWLGMRLDESELRFQCGYQNPSLPEFEKYYRLPPGTPTSLGAAAGGDGAMRLVFSPTALWALAKEKLPGKELDQVTGVVSAATGLDLVEDVINNFTGEIVYRWSDHGIAMFFTARDNKRTANVLEKLDNLAAGGIAMMGQHPSTGAKIDRDVDEVRGVKAYHYKLDIPGEIMKLPQPFKYELHFAAGKGALVWAFDRAGLDDGLANLGKPAQKTIDEMPADARALFAGSAPIVAYIRGADPSYWMKNPMMSSARATYDKISPKIWPIMMETMNVWELIWDGTTLLDSHGDKAVLDYTVRFL
jgi:hypothetical protein